MSVMRTPEAVPHEFVRACRNELDALNLCMNMSGLSDETIRDAQIRQWQHGYAERKPSFENSVAIERATDGQVTVEELRPDATWLRVKDKTWPHPKGRPVLDFALAEPKAEQGA